MHNALRAAGRSAMLAKQTLTHTHTNTHTHIYLYIHWAAYGCFCESKSCLLQFQLPYEGLHRWPNKQGSYPV